MPFWILSPIDPNAMVWSDFSRLQKIVVRALSAREARDTCAKAQQSMRQKPWGGSALRPALENPWRRPSDTSCEKVDSYTTLDGDKIEPDGPAEVVWRE